MELSGWIRRWWVWLWICFSTTVPAAPVLVASSDWLGFAQDDGHGLYFDVIRAALKTQGISIQTQASNWKRARFAFAEQRVDILACDYKENHPNAIYPRWHLDTDPAVILFSRHHVASLSQLADQPVAWVLGYEFAKLVPATVQVLEVSTHADGFRLLQLGRVSAVISYAEQVPTEWALPLYQYPLQPPRALYPVFQNTQAGRELALKFDAGMAQLYASGQLQPMYKPLIWQRAALPPTMVTAAQ